jgi:NAD(P)-dependent dehydrogenase (short-subunit alcohol dehydrogenase family)
MIVHSKMVANAGVAPRGTAVDSKHESSDKLDWADLRILLVKVEDLDHTYAVNVRGTMLCYKYAAIQMIAQGRGGRIIGASSTTGKKGDDLPASVRPGLVNRIMCFQDSHQRGRTARPSLRSGG